MSLTGYNILNGGVAADLSTIFEPLPVGGTMYETPTGFIQYSTGKDLRELFAVNTSYTIPYNTNWIAQNGQDLRYIFQGIEPQLLVTITGTGANTYNKTGNKHTYTFTSGTRQISINKNVTLHVIVVGGGGPGRNGTSDALGGGGAGGGCGQVVFSYDKDTSYNIYVAPVVGSDKTSGQSSYFLNSGGQGVTSTGGARGTGNNTTIRAIPGTSINNGTGTFTTFNSGDGGAWGPSTNAPNRGGGSSNSSFFVLGVSYQYGGGGAAGGGVASNILNKGGNAGSRGSGGSPNTNQDNSNGESASPFFNPTNGGGGGAWYTGAIGGNGGPGQVIVIFTYP